MKVFEKLRKIAKVGVHSTPFLQHRQIGTRSVTSTSGTGTEEWKECRCRHVGLELPDCDLKICFYVLNIAIWVSRKIFLDVFGCLVNSTEKNSEERRVFHVCFSLLKGFHGVCCRSSWRSTVCSHLAIRREPFLPPMFMLLFCCCSFWHFWSCRFAG